MNEWIHRHQLEIKEHINELARIQEHKAEDLYETKREEFVRQNFDKRKTEVAKVLENSIKKFKESVEEVEERAEKIG